MWPGMRTGLGAAVAACIATAGSAQAQTCTAERSYTFMWATCLQDGVSGEPRSVCETREGQDLRMVLLISDVVRDDRRNDRHPTTLFHRELDLQQNVSEIGRQATCYATRRDAEEARRDHLADFKRRQNGPALIVSISMPGTL